MLHLVVWASLSTFLAAATLCGGCDRSAPSGAAPVAEPVTMLVAASAADAVRECAERMTAAGGPEVRLNVGASSTLAGQIRAGAPADLFLSADERWMEDVVTAGAMDAASRLDLLGNDLVLVAPSDSTLVMGERGVPPPIERLAVADPEHVPAGRYAQQSLEWLGWWTELRPRLLAASDVRAALRLVELGEADAGIVYATDAAASRGVRVVAALPEGSHAPIRYPIALRVGAGAGPQAFLRELRGPAARATFERAGFRVLAPAESPADGQGR